MHICLYSVCAIAHGLSRTVNYEPASFVVVILKKKKKEREKRTNLISLIGGARGE
jgi:hypothetical protein